MDKRTNEFFVEGDFDITYPSETPKRQFRDIYKGTFENLSKKIKNYAVTPFVIEFKKLFI